MGKSDFPLPTFNAHCDVCGAEFNRKYGNEQSGKFVCTFCTRYRHVIHCVRFVEYMAAKECQQLVDKDGVVWRPDEDPYGDHPLRYDLRSNLDCSCDTCSARKVLKFMVQYQRALR